MLRYATGLVKIIPDYFEISEETNFYEIVVLFFLNELDKLLHRGLNSGYKSYEENLNCVKGKILFKEHLVNNFGRSDRIFCSYSELTMDILENQIIKNTLYYLSQCYFQDERIDSKILSYYNRFDQVSLISYSSESEIFKLIEYTPLNEHYRPILSLCDLLLKDASIDEEKLGEKTAISFLVDMNALFEKFISNLFKEKLQKKNKKIKIEEQKLEYADITNDKIQLKIDLLISYGNKPILILDTKYMEFKNIDTAHVAQMVLYSNSTKVKNCCLVYTGGGNTRRIYNYLLYHGIELHILSFDLQATDKYQFEAKCNDFINFVYLLIESLINK